MKQMQMNLGDEESALQGKAHKPDHHSSPLSGKYFCTGCKPFMENVPVGLFECLADDGGMITWINGAGATVLEYAFPDELIGRQLVDLFSNSEEGERLYQALLQSGSVYDSTALGIKNDGQELQLQLSCKVVRPPVVAPLLSMVCFGMLRRETKSVPDACKETLQPKH